MAAPSIGVAQDQARQEYLELLAERDRLARDVGVMEREMDLTESRRPYVVVDLHSGALILKVHGLALKRIEPVEVQKLGRIDCAAGAAVLEEFEAPPPPSVDASGPAESADTVLVSEMPQSYDLGFVSGDRSTLLLIRPAPAHALSRMWMGLAGAFVSTGSSVRQSLGSKRSVYRLLLVSEDAQGLFWALEKGTPAIIVCQ